MVRVLSLLSLENGCHNSHSKSKIREICKVTLCWGRGFTSKPLFHPERLPICKVSKFCWNRAEQGASDAYIAQDEIITAVRPQWRHNSEVSNPGWNASDTNFDARRSFRPHLKPKGVACVKVVYDLSFWGCLASVVGIGEGPCLEESLYQWTHFCFIQTVNFQWQMPDSWPQVKDTQQWFTVFNKGTDTTERCQVFLHHLQFCYKRKEFLLNEWDLLFQRLACSGIKMEVCSQSKALSHLLLLRWSCIKNNPV